MGELTAAAKEQALLAVFSTAMLGLTRNGVEIADPGYTRQIVLMEHDHRRSRGKYVVVTNQAEIFFGYWEEAATEAITGWFIARIDGVVIAKGEIPLDDQFPPRKGEELVVRVGTIIVGMP